MTLKYLNQLFELGKIQGEHNARWQDEYCRKLSCELYYEKTKHILEDNNIVYNKSCEDFREYDGEEEYYLLDKLTFDMVEELREYLIRKILEEE